MRRLGIFLFYDGKGRVSPHVHRSVKAFSPHFERFIFVANGDLDMESYAGLEDYITDLLPRENIGFDVWGYKEGLEYIGYENLDHYDEIVLLNYTFFAPLHDLSTMFTRMEARKDLDGWGMSEYSSPGKSFLQSYFLCTRKSLHGGFDFRSYWQEMPTIKSIDDSLDLHEFRFSRHFRDLGYKLEPYIKNRKAWTGNTTLVDVEGMFDDGAPIIKYRAFNFEPDVIETRGGRKIVDNFALVQNQTDYPVSEVWDYIINQTPPDDLIGAAELCRVVSDTGPVADDLLVIVTLEDITTLDMAFERLDRLAPEQVVIASNLPEIREAALERGYRVEELQAMRIAILVSAKYLSDKTVAIVHLSDFAQERDRYFFKDSLFRNYWDPLLSNEARRWLAKDDHMGLLFAFPDAVLALSSYRDGTNRSLSNWDPDYRPDYLMRARGQSYWPWRGNMMIRATLALDTKFQQELSGMLENFLQQHEARLAGPEGAFPEMVRDHGYASGIVVPKSESNKLLLRSVVQAKATTRKLNTARQTFQNQLSVLASAHLDKAPNPSTDTKIAHLISGGLSIHRRYLLKTDLQQIALTGKLKLRYTFDHWSIEGDKIKMAGWAFDEENPDDIIQIGLLHKKSFIFGPMLFNKSRPDVTEVFGVLPLSGHSGFDFSVGGVDTQHLSRYQLVFVNRVRQTIKLLDVKRDKAPYSLRLLARRIRTKLVTLIRRMISTPSSE